MQIYYNEFDNKIILNKKGFDNVTYSNHGFFNEVYPLGYLLIEFIELDFDKIIKTAEDKLNLSIPKSKELIPEHFLKIRNFYDYLKSIHPYFWDYTLEFEKKIEWYEYYLISRIHYEEILSHNEEWFTEEKNINSIIDMKDILISFDAKRLKNKLINLSEFKKVLNSVLQNELPHHEFNEWNLIGSLKAWIYECRKVCENFRKVVEFCIDKENLKEFINLSPLQRYYLYCLKGDNDIKYISPGISYSINSIDDGDCFLDKTKNYTNEELVKLLPQNPITLYEVYETHVEAACYFELIKLISKGILIRKCSNCHKYFINTGRADTLYCDRPISEDEKTCKDVGAMNLYREKTKNDPIMDEYNKIYKRNNARVRYKKMSKNDFFVWSEKARTMRDKTKSGEITLEEFKNWLGQN